MISRCDSAAIVSNTSELLPEPETPVNTVSRRFGISTLTSLRLFTRAPCTRIRSWLSAACGAGDCVSVVVAVTVPIVAGGRSALQTAVRAGSRRGRRSSVLEQPEDIAVGVGDGGHQPAAADVVRGSWTVAPAAVTSASFASMSGTCQ